MAAIDSRLVQIEEQLRGMSARLDRATLPGPDVKPPASGFLKWTGPELPKLVGVLVLLLISRLRSNAHAGRSPGDSPSMRNVFMNGRVARTAQAWAAVLVAVFALPAPAAIVECATMGASGYAVFLDEPVATTAAFANHEGVLSFLQ